MGRTKSRTLFQRQSEKAVLGQTSMGVFLFVQCLLQLKCFFFRNRLMTIWRIAAHHRVRNTALYQRHRLLHEGGLCLPL